MKVLVVDDDPAFRRYTTLGLDEAGIEHVTAPDVPRAISVLEAPDGAELDAVLLDVELPGPRGWELVERLRAHGNDLPVLLLSVHGGVEEKVKGLQLGADDYLVKPVPFEELVARLHAVVRRRLRSSGTRLGRLELDPFRRRIAGGGKSIELSPKEFDVLWALVQAEGRTLSGRELLRRAWGLAGGPATNVVQVHVFRLRKKLAACGVGRIETVRWKGYRYVS